MFCPKCGAPMDVVSTHGCDGSGRPGRTENRTLVAFWLVSDLPHAPIGFGVTAFDLDEAIETIAKSGYDPYLPDDRARLTVTANPKFDDLPPHVRGRCGPIVVRGLWFPWPTPGWFSRGW